MKKKRSKIISIVLSIFIVITIFPMSVYAKDKVIEELNVTVKKPIVNADFSQEDKAYHANLNEDCGLELLNESWLKLEDVDSGGKPDFVKFEDESTYFLLAFFKVKEGYKLPKDLSKINVQMIFTNSDRESPEYVSPNKYKYESGTYTIDADDPVPDTYLSLIYSVKTELKQADKLNIRVKAPVTDVQYSKNSELLAPFEPVVEKNHGYKEGKSTWMYFNEDNEALITEMFVPGGNYVLSVGVKLLDGYKLPDELSDISVTIDYDDAPDVVLKKDNYRLPEDFNPMETGTYTIETFKSDSGIKEFDLMYAVKPFNAVEKDVTFYYAEPIVGEKTMQEPFRFNFEANSADGIAAVGTLWEKKLIGNLYVPAKEFREGELYRATVILHVKDGYNLPENLKDINVTLVDEYYNETKLTNKDFKIIPYMIGTEQAGYKFIYTLPHTLIAQKDESSQPSLNTDVSETESDGLKEESKENIPNTGAASFTVTAAFALFACGAALVTKKYKK